MTKKEATQRCALRLRDIELPVNLGWEEEEREQQQMVQLDIIINFQTIPKACASDRLQDTFCYATLIQHLREYVEDKTYRLVEHLTQDLYQLIKKKIKGHHCLLHLTKHPSVEGLSGGVTFSYGDESVCSF